MTAIIRRIAFPVLLPVGLIALNSANAAEWTRSAGIAPAVTYSDNVCLDAEDEQGEWIALVTPDVSLNGSGRRANILLAGSVEVNSLTDSRLDNLGCNPAGFGDREQFAPRLNAAADAVLVEDWLFIDAGANVDQNEIDAFRAGGGDSLNRTGNTNTSYRYNVSPYLARRFKDVADLSLRYRYDDEINSEDIVGQSVQHTVLFNLDNASTGAPFTWGVEGSYDKIEYDETEARASNADESELKSARLRLGYQLDRTWQVNGFYGQEWNDFVSDNDDIDGNFWDVGFRWTPGERTTVEAGTGNRFFGDTYRYSISHRHKRSTLSVDYSEDLTYDRNIRTLDDSLPIDDFDPSNPTTLSNSPILDERLTLGYVFQGRRTTVNVRASHSDQTRAEDGRDSTFNRVSVSMNRTLARRLSVSASMSWNEEEPQGERSELVTQSETWTGSLGVNKQLNKDVDLSLDYRYTDRQSDSEINEYQENRVTLTLRFNLL